jgi:PKD repeat protein
MKIFKLTSLALVSFLAFSNIQAQSSRVGSWCGSDQMAEQSRMQNPTLIEREQELENFISKFKESYDPVAKKVTIIIPVVVHNITHGNNKGYVSKAQIEAQLLTLNQDYNRTNPDAGNTRALFAPHAGSIDIEFRLAHIDPNGECTEGIVRAESPYSFSTSTAQAENVKAVSYWSSQKYFNIWVIDEIQDNGDGSFVAGYAQFPGQNNNGEYGVVVADQSFGAGDRTLTHELGHCLNLYHTFNYGSCGGGGDNCSDTPPVIEASFNCDVNRNTCSNDGTYYGGDVVDQFENYMSYANCQNMFTLQQESRMMAILTSTSTNSGVGQLALTSNLNATGTNNPYGPVICKPIADFTYDKDYVCEGDAVTFEDDSYNATPTGWNWTFTGGTPSFSGVATPTITYNTAGVYSVTHEPSTTAGSDIITKNSIITVSSLIADYISPVVDGFENTTTFNNDWIVKGGPDAYKWSNSTAAAATGSRAIRLLNYNANSTSEIDYMISPSYDLSASANKDLKFKYAFAKKNSANTDRLMIYYSTDCGATWSLKLPITSSTLPTAPIHTGPFVPTASEWVEKTVNFSSIGTSTNVRIKFQFEAGEGNNIYIDDINIGDNGGVGINDITSPVVNFNVYPNPTKSSAVISFNLLENVNNLSIKVKNAVGQEVTNVIDNQSFSSGKYTLRIDEGKKLASGIYFIEFNADNNIKIRKLIVQ